MGEGGSAFYVLDMSCDEEGNTRVIETEPEVERSRDRQP